MIQSNYIKLQAVKAINYHIKISQIKLALSVNHLRVIYI